MEALSNNSNLDLAIKTIPLGVKCPICRSSELKMLHYPINIPYVGRLLITTIYCPKCKFKISDVWTILDKGNRKRIHKITIDSETIHDLVCACAGSQIRIPEIDAVIEIKTFDAQAITTVEGILKEILDALDLMANSAEDNDKAEKIRNLLASEIEKPTGALTLILEDPHQHSVIIPHKHWLKRAVAEKMELSEQEVRSIGKKILRKWFDLERS